MVEPRPLPRPVCAGARIGVFALAGPVDGRRLAPGLRTLRGLGFEPVPAANLLSRNGYLAGDDDARLDGLGGLLDDGVEALLAARGGYGTTRLLDRLPWERLARWGGWIVGFSDVTALHAAAGGRLPFATLHGPMTTTLGRHRPSTSALARWLTGHPPRTLFRFSQARVVRGGRARGVAVGGNLSLLAALEGTPYAPDLEGAVVFVEEVGEPLYRVDRMLTQLRLSSRLGRATAIVVGTPLRCGRGERGWRQRWREVILEAAPPDAVVLEGLPFGHGLVNVPIPLGVEVEIDTARGRIGLGGTEWSRSASTRAGRVTTGPS